uniref:Laminin, alpha 1 n=1 Tax=Oreochromis niloticus TaxID=8128 RepID=A0A669E7N6_ORENI
MLCYRHVGLCVFVLFNTKNLCTLFQCKSLFPAILNLASNAVISSNATCGEPEPEVYCKLVEHVPGRRIKNPHCLKCDYSSLSAERHPITNAIDGTNRWWQSPSIKNGQQFHWITITLDLKQVFQIAYIIIKAANSPRPGNWILERSLDGISFEPWQFYAISDSECLYRYNITPRLGPPTYKSDTEVICTSYYSRLNPLEHGEIHTSLINGRPGADDLTSDLLNFTSARYIRLRLQRIRTLNADLMTLSARDPREIDPIVTRRYYYSIKDISVGGMCICYGHAQSCPLDPVSKKLHCVCEHNTCGESCNKCCPGYHQQPWQPGTISDGNTCEKCNCHNKADNCYYNQTISDLSLSLNTHGVRRGGGVCFNCQQNTAGINCETCKDGYYRPAEVSPYSDFPCVECKCDLRGSKSSVCTRDNTQPGLLVGQCMCKEGFAGQQCDRCAFGYRDFPQCVRCECNLSGSINTDPCSPCICKENVMGAHCDLCKPGFFNLKESNPLGCTSCFCFGVSDVCESSGLSIGQVVTAEALLFLSETITTTPVFHSNEIPIHSNISSGATHQQMLWWEAPQSFLGNKVSYHFHICSLCQTHASLSIYCFYRVGGILFGGNCMQCECNDHATECDIHGVCVACTHNTTGSHCDQCLQGFYGDATEGTTDDCQLCPCPLTEPSNRFSPTCVLDPSGQVLCDQCKDGYTGTNCEKCASGFYGNPQVVGGTCIRCECNGNVDISEVGHCDTVTGECLRCLGNTAGRHCELCQPGYYGDAVHTKDCWECDCDVNGALSSQCNVTTGQCFCRENVTGRTCDHCKSGFYGLQSGHGCIPCGCSKSGSLFESCDKEGQCQCVEGVTGHKCDRCSRGYYGFHDKGCIACSCDHTGGNCNPENGECICPAHTEGETCNKCVKNYWGHNPTTGCKPCSCSEAGSSSPLCDLTNGQCLCKEGFFGRSCDQCAPGYYGYPACSACGCDMAGTEETFCNATLGVCSCQNTGNCVCKPGVSGRRCEECVSGWFGLSAENLDGCLQCFCSGLSRDCEEQGGLTRVPVSTYLSNLQGTVSGVYRQGSEMLLDTRQLNTSGLTGPLYWRLPNQFEGNQLLSYGGLLSYTVTFYAEDGAGLSNQEPQVLMRGGTLRKLAIYTDIIAPGNGVTTQHDIRLTEHKWKYFNSVSQRVVSHADFMSVLSNIEYIIIKASYGTRLQQSRISNITMEMAVEVEESEVRENVARLIESCICPPGYTGLSCQVITMCWYNCIPGGSMFVRPCVPCRCNNHSQSCYTETGECQDCKHHTSGQSCEKCASGYYGSVKGFIDDCSPCACPLLNNSFSPTCILEGAAGDFRCTACQPGYEGRYCERCSVGYYGNPSVPGGVCSQCSCTAWGSLHLLCDVLTGECECKDGVKGQSCNECEERNIFQEGECVSCDDKCTGILLDELDELHNHFLFFNLSTIAMSSYRQLWLLENQTREMQVQKLLQREAAHLNQTAEEELGSANQTHLLEDVESILNSIKDVNLTAAEVVANQELRSMQHKMEEAEYRTQHLMDRIKPMRMLGETLSRNLSDIRELIYQARRQAASIKVALQADRGCVRSYRPSVQSSNFNTLNLIVKTTTPDNLLFYLGSNTTMDFLAAEMHNGQVSLLWDVGSGSTRLEFPGLDITNNRWTKINATRFGPHVALSVHQLDSKSALLPAVTATSPGTFQVLDIDENSFVHIGGLGRPAALRSTTFQGCLGEASLNEQNIGLWNYDHREGECGGCFSSPQAEETSFHFDGSGYSVVQKSLRSTSTLIVLQFKTLSPVGLLLYLASNNTVRHTHLQDFLSMELVEGRVRLTFDLGSGALMLTSNRKYNTGVWYKITLQRNKRKGTNITPSNIPAATSVSTLLNASDLNRSDLDPIFIGGFPASRPIRQLSDHKGDRFLLLCVTLHLSHCCVVFCLTFVSATVSVPFLSVSVRLLFRSWALDGLILLLSDSKQMDFVVLSLKGGRLMMSADLGKGLASITSSVAVNNGEWHTVMHDGYKVGSDMTVSLEFQTSQSEGVLLGISSAKVDAVGLEIINGQVVFNVNNGAGRVSVRSVGQMLCDGQWHRLVAQKTKHAFSLTVDERTYTTANPYPQSTSAETNNPVFLGGYPAGVKQNCLSISSSFRGCLRNLQLLKSHLTKSLDLSSAHFLLGITPNSCPAS